MNKIVLILSFFVFSCKGSNSETLAEKDIATDKCNVPALVLNYLKQNESKFKFIDETKELNLLKDFLSTNTCPTIAYGDFNNNGNKDVALILRYTGYDAAEFKNYSFPFLVVFNDYEKEVKPIIVYKTGDYQNEDIKTVVYDQFEDGIFSYIQKGNLCDKDVIDIIIPEKSSFFVMWNEQKKIYEYFNILDEVDCDKSINSTQNQEIPIPNEWFGDYSLTIDYGKLDEFAEIMIEYDISIDKDKCSFSGIGYKTYFTDECNCKMENGELIIKYVAQTEGDGMSDHSHHDTLATIKKEKNKYFIQSPIIADKNWNYNSPIEIKK